MRIVAHEFPYASDGAQVKFRIAIRSGIWPGSCSVGEEARCQTMQRRHRGGTWRMAFAGLLAAIAADACLANLALAQVVEDSAGIVTAVEPEPQPVKKAKKPIKAAVKPVDKAAATTPKSTANGGDTAIIVVINDEPISNYKVDQRVSLLRMMGGDNLGQKLKARLQAPGIQDQFRKFATKRNPKSKEEVVALQREFVEGIKRQVMAEASPGSRDKALVELINERLQLQEAKRLDLMVADDELDGMMVELAKKNGKSSKDFEAALGGQGIRRDTFRERMRAQASWQRVLARRFRGQIAVANNEVDQGVATGSLAAAAGPEMQVQRVTIAQTAGADDATTAASYAEAEKLVSKAKGCKNFQALAKKIPGAKFETLDKISAGALPEQARPILANAKAGDVPPPMLTAAGIEVYAVCKIAAVEGDAPPAAPATPDEQRSSVRAKIEQSKLAALSKGLLSDLCSNASIEYRNGATSKRACGGD